VLVRQERVGEAVAEFRKAIGVDPHYVPAYNNLAEALVEQGKLEEAEHYYRQSLAEKPSPAVQNALAAVQRQLGK
jgi:pentatricopeptide repeat protein